MRISTFLLPIFVIFIFTGCTTLYVPSTNQTHMMQNKGEIHLAGNVGANGLNLQGGYAFTDRYGVVASVSGRSSDGSNDTAVEDHTYVEAGINYFGFGEGNFSGELTAGFGFGTGERENARGEFTKPFIQVNGAFTSGNFDTGLSLRTAYLSFSELVVQNDRPGDSSVFFEPALFVRLGFERVKLESQLGLAYPLSDSGNFAFGYEPIRMSVGLKFVFNRPE